MHWIALVGICFGVTTVAALADDSVVSVERGFQLSKDLTCHECHTAGYYKRTKRIDPETAFKGTTRPYFGPWGTLYAKNIRLIVKDQTEDEFVQYATTLIGSGPMIYFANVLRGLSDSDKRSLYRYVKSLGEPGEPEPAATGPDGQPLTK